jgi:hypothetical protein
MPASSLDIELSKYWSLLTPEQKKSLLEVIKSFVQSPEITNLEIKEAETEYGAGNISFSKILSQLNQQQKNALINLLQSFEVEGLNQRISIEQYNKELDEAEAEFQRGEFISNEEIVAMSKKWIHGK